MEKFVIVIVENGKQQKKKKKEIKKYILTFWQSVMIYFIFAEKVKVYLILNITTYHQKERTVGNLMIFLKNPSTILSIQLRLFLSLISKYAIFSQTNKN